MKIRNLLALVLMIVAIPVSPAQADAKWSPIADNDYIFGYTSYKYSCWSGVTDDNPPTIEVYSNDKWVTAVVGQILPPGSDLKTPCESDFPIAVGFTWTVMSPSPPAYQTNRYTALYRQKIPDREIVTQRLVSTQVEEEIELCCKTKTSTKKVPYIAKVKKNGKTENVIKYKMVKYQERVRYITTVLVDKNEWQDFSTKVPGWTGESRNFSIYSSVAAMNAEYAAVANAVLCSFGFKEKCTK